MSHEALSGHTCKSSFPVDDEHHMVFDCSALEEVRVQHAGLFAGSADLFLSAGVIAGGCLCVCGFCSGAGGLNI